MRNGGWTVLAGAFLLGGCFLGYPNFLLWTGFRPHDESKLVAGSTPSCPGVGVQNLTPEERRILIAAMAETCRIIASSAFERAVKARAWLATCNKPGGKPDVVSGEEAYRLYVSGIRSFSVRFRKPWNADAVTQIRLRRIAIRRQRLEAWRAAGIRNDMSELINTLAHEMTHMVPDDPAAAAPRFRFQDKGHKERNASALELVSYGLGNLAERLWLAEAGLAPLKAPAKVESC
jgi:hypothetical protein